MAVIEFHNIPLLSPKFLPIIMGRNMGRKKELGHGATNT